MAAAIPHERGVPQEILNWIGTVFRACNRRITRKIDLVPNVPEPSLDLTWIEHISRYSSPRTFPGGWRIKLETHYLGGLRHWFQWEIADIGVIVRYRIPEGTVKRKVALLQSKRLIPANAQVREETRSDYEVGFARLDDPEDERRSLALERVFRFTESSEYREIELGSKQTEAIQGYARDTGLRVYYQLYNPWTIPWDGRVPIEVYQQPAGNPRIGVRLLPSEYIHSTLRKNHERPAFSDLRHLIGYPRHGWRLEDFVVDLVKCRHGDRATNRQIFDLFNRRSGPISAAISITVEAPDQTFADALESDDVQT